ncbi:MAG: hypothetical protein V7K92_15685 [Nostoc sp.]
MGTCTELVLSVAVGVASRREGRLVPSGAEVSRKACGIATLRAQPLQELYWVLGMGNESLRWMNESLRWMNESLRWMNESLRWMNESLRWMNESLRWMNESLRWMNESLRWMNESLRWMNESLRWINESLNQCFRDFQEINYPNKRTTETQRTQRREIKRIFASVLGYFFIWKSLNF